MTVYEQQPIPSVAVVIPLLNEAKSIPRLLENLAKLNVDECIFVDGGSNDNTLPLLGDLSSALPGRVQIIHSPPGRARQMNAGANASQADYLVFLHADSYLPANVRHVIHQAVEQQRQWGRFDVRFYDDHGIQFAMRIIAFFINLRSRLTSIATGDQAIFVARDLFFTAGEFPRQALMEDVALSRQLKAYCVPFSATEQVNTSARRWQQNGVFRTVMQMWGLRLAYFFGVSANRLAASYKHIR